MEITKEHINHRLLICYSGLEEIDSSLEILEIGDEVTLIEISPSGRRGKFYFHKNNEYRWELINLWTILEVLSPPVVNVPTVWTTPITTPITTPQYTFTTTNGDEEHPCDKCENRNGKHGACCCSLPYLWSQRNVNKTELK